ncbi:MULTISPECIES: PaaI family thioesterase [Pseudomonas]|uniref:PaaI family thioesterase n=1 Tax=Pseudomonas TaxID=286 RepID=UPI0020980EA7|nr:MULTISPECIES: PaaI family thioesterase [Pseudomonas]MCO7578683.1 PaaI family thioesterase [Pseudomonas protegens]MCO7585616.1 PaaI family thioesterase [Pseudomonas chlororaphis]MCO7601749.1 PaaI family thioesterase [Pseudomonas chlororaphis]MDC7817869.1 PaaI family thioesterase [Pseudomonas sp. BLCC-B112]
MHETSLQDTTAPEGVCFGCGSSNHHGLQIKSHWHEDGEHVIAEHLPQSQYCGWPDLVYGGLIAMLVDCHSNWTAMAYHYRNEQREPGSLPRIDCVTGNLGIKFIKPTPMGVPLTLRAKVEGDVGRKSRVICEVYAGDVLTAIGDSVFVRVDTEQLAAAAHGRGA